MPSGTATRGWPLVRVLLLVAAIPLLVDGLVLMALRHFNLGVLLPAALGAAMLAMAVRWGPLSQWRQRKPRNEHLWRLGWWGMAVWVASVAVFWWFLLGVGVSPAAAPPVQAIVVLGSGIRDGAPRPPLAARLDTAAALAQLQPGAVIAVTGGVDWGETESEGAVMARYLQQRHGIAPDRLVVEEESTSTELNLLRTMPLLKARGITPATPVAMVTSDFHLMRAMRIARRQGLTGMVPVAAPTPLPTRYNAWLREYFATLSSWALREG